MNIDEAIAAVKANPPLSPLPWRDKSGAIWGANGLLADGLYADDAKCARARVNAAPVLIAEVERLIAAVATAERLREEDRMKLIRCKSAMREWQVASEFADDRAVKANKEVARLQAVVEAARVAVEKWAVPSHSGFCDHSCGDGCTNHQPCNCDHAAKVAARTEALRALGLE